MAEEFEKEEYGDAAEGMSKSQIQARINELMKNPTCGVEKCTAKTVDPAEEAWLRLMSAVPKNGQSAAIDAGRDIPQYALPDKASVGDLVRSLRPSQPDLYSIEQISSEWKTFYSTFNNVPNELKNGLSTLSEDWEGEDYDAFEEQVEKVIKNARTILADIWGEEGTVGGAVKLLDDKSDSIYQQQGGNECVYPSPKFHLEDAAACSHKIHIRPAYFPECKVFPDDETKVAMEWAGFDSSIVDEVQEERERIYNMYIDHTNQYPEYEEDGMRGEELARTRADEYAKRATDDLGTDGQDQLQAEAARVNGDITDRHSNTDMAVSEITPEAAPSEQTAFNDGDTEPPGGLDGGSLPGGGSPPGLDNMTPPGNMKPVTPSTPSMPDNPTNPDYPGNPDLPGNPPGTGDPGGIDDDPWTPSTPDPDDLPSGGLAGGGGGGLGGGGGGLPGGGGAGGGLPGGGAGGGLPGGGIGAGAMGGMMGAGGGAGRGAGGAGGGRGGGRGPGGMGRGAGAMGGMMGGAGGRPGGAPGEDGGETGTWLTEDDDVWGIGNENEDPYA